MKLHSQHKAMELKEALSRRFYCILIKATQTFNINHFFNMKYFVGYREENIN